MTINTKTNKLKMAASAVAPFILPAAIAAGLGVALAPGVLLNIPPLKAGPGRNNLRERAFRTMQVTNASTAVHGVILFAILLGLFVFLARRSKAV